MFVALCLALFIQLPAHATDLEAVRLLQAPDRTRLEFDLNGGFSYNVFDLDNPDRVVIDIAVPNC